MRYLLILLIILFSNELIAREQDQIKGVKLDKELAKGKYDLYLCLEFDKEAVGAYMMSSNGNEFNVPICINRGEYGPMGYRTKRDL